MLNEMIKRLSTSESLTDDEVYDLVSKICYKIMIANKIGNFSDDVVMGIKKQILAEANRYRFENKLDFLYYKIE